MKKRIVIFVLVCIFCVSIASFGTPAAAAVSSEPELVFVKEGLVGWENWQSQKSIYGDIIHYKLSCPFEGATVDDIFYYTTKLISEDLSILSELYGESGVNPSSIHLLFNWPALGALPEAAVSHLDKFLNSVEILYDGTLVEFRVRNTSSSQEDKGVAQIDVALINKSATWSDFRYNASTGAYEITDIEFYDELDDIEEYRTFGKRKGNWVQNGWMLYSWDMFRLADAQIMRSDFEIFDAASFDRTILSQPYTRVSSINNVDYNYVLVKDRSITETAPAVRAKIHDLCEAAKAASTSRTGQLRYINDYLCSHVKYDYDFYEWIISGHKTPYDSTKGVVPNNAYGALVDGLAICSGFSHAVSEACNYLGIPNFYIESEDHIWNMVYVDNKWKMLDVTWNATGNNTSRYFLVDSITEPSGSHTYDPAKVETEKADTLAYWDLKYHYDAFFESNAEHNEIINKLVDMGIFLGNEKGELNMHKGLTRAELATLLTRLNGKENEVKAKSAYYASASPFKDVPAWAAPYVGYCYEQGLMKGCGDTVFGAIDTVNVKMACTVILRYLGCSETDWSYDTSVEKALSVGLMPTSWPTGTTALRNDLALMIDTALSQKAAA
jgi:hypothetical protein